MAEALRRLLRGRQDNAVQRWGLLRIMVSGGTGRLAVSLATHIVLGVAPAVFIFFSSSIMAHLPGAVLGTDSHDWQVVRDYLIGSAAVVLVIQLVGPAERLVTQTVMFRIDNAMRERLLRASFVPSGIAMFEDQRVLRRIASVAHLLRTSGTTPGAACVGHLALVSRYLQALTAGLLMSIVYRWWAGILVVTACLIIRVGNRTGLTIVGRVWEGLLPLQRERWYYRNLMLDLKSGKEIRIFGLLSWLVARYGAAARRSLEPLWRCRRRVFFLPHVGYTVIAIVVAGLVLAGTGASAAQGTLSVGALALVLQATVGIARIGQHFPESDAQIEYGLAALRELVVFENLVGDGEATTGPCGAIDIPTTADIVFDRVTFAYAEGARLAVTDLNLTIRAGQSLAIVGVNGAGKTTLVRLLVRLYEPQQGRITVAGTDLADLPVAGWRERVVVASQDPVRFEFSLRKNVAMGLADDDDAVARALAVAGLADLPDRLPQGIDTILSPHYRNGVDLSGGQWQRVAIARSYAALHAGASVLVLDEPTANLDVRAEAEFFDTFMEAVRGRTVVLISHRFSTVRKADRIVVLDGGRVVEDGSHDELMDVNGLYSTMFRRQAAGFADTDTASRSDQDVSR